MRTSHLGLLFVLCVGCDIVASEDLDTSELSADITVTSGERGLTEVRVVLERDGSVNDRVQLSAGDELVAKVGKERVILSEDDGPFDNLSYVGTLSGHDAGTQVTVALERDDARDASATATIPAAFRIDGPTAGQTLAIDAPVKVRWSGGQRGTDVELAYDADCDDSATSGSHTEKDDGAADLTMELSSEDGPHPTECDVTLTVRRRLAGSLSGDWSGSAYGQVERAVDFSVR